MTKENIKHLCKSGAFDAFKEICEEMTEPEIWHSDSEEVLYQVGIRDGFRQFKQELFDLIEKLAQE